MLAIILFTLGYFAQFDNLPNGVHFIRQSDSFSFLLNYLYFDNSFLAPANFNLYSENGNAASEFPLFYYIGALIASLGANPIVVLRVIHALIFFAGIQLIYSRILSSTNNALVALPAAFILVCSTIVLYYSNNFLPDIAALGLSLAGISFLLKKPSPQFKIALVLFTIATMVKITYGIYPLATLGAILITEKVNFLKSKLALYGVGFVLLVGSWWSFASFYNKNSNNDYYFNKSIPIWNTSEPDIERTNALVLHYWKNSYYPESTQILFVVMFALTIFTIKKTSLIERAFASFSLAGIAAYIILFYQKFADHDYYFLVLIPFIATIFILGIRNLLETYNGSTIKSASFSILTVFSIASFVYVNKKIPLRWNDSESLISYHSKLETIQANLDKSDPNHLNKILVVGDSTMNGTLFQLGRKGYAVPIIPKTNLDVIDDKKIANVSWIILLKDPGNQNAILNDLSAEITEFPCLISINK